MRRELIKISSSVIAEAHDETKESHTVLEYAQNKIIELTNVNTKRTIQPMVDVINQTFETILARTQNPNTHTGIDSGLEKLDDLTSGFQNSELVIIGARPSVGKTALALTMIQHIAIKNKIPAAFFSLEMSALQIGMRLISQEARLDSKKLRGGTLSQADIFKLQEAAGRCYDAPFFISDSTDASILELRALSRRMVLEHQVKIIFIDYISLIRNEDTKIKVQRYEQVGEISRSLKSMARELNIPVVALSQLGRDMEKTKHRPMLADIRESGSIEQDADVVIFIHRDKEKQEQEQAEGKFQPLETELILAKQRSGPIGTVKVIYFPTFTKFENMAYNN
jgi:replicative DNA helicase